MNLAYKITGKAVFPEGAAPGAGSISNRKTVAKNGRGEVVLRGSALAGVLRHAYAKKFGTEGGHGTDVWFGTALNGEHDKPSFIKVPDAVVKSPTVLERTHNMVNRHTGAVMTGALVSFEALPPMASASISITLKPGAGDDKAYAEFISDLAGLLSCGLTVGGSSNRGIGRMIIEGSLFLRRFDLDTISGAAGFMDAEYEEQAKGVALEGEVLEAGTDQNQLNISLVLGIPRGEDLLIGDGQERDYALQPQSVLFSDGTKHWRIPGASLRGIFRGWMTRLAARDNATIRDSVSQWQDMEDTGRTSLFRPNFVGWGCFGRQDATREECARAVREDPILDLFGSLHKKGRIHVSDAFSIAPVSDDDTQDRMHVAVDRFYGGAREGALFTNQVLIGGIHSFPVEITIKNPKDREIYYLVKTLRALHLGILLVGSSKSSGHLEIKSFSATGMGSDHQAFTSFEQEIK